VKAGRSATAQAATEADAAFRICAALLLAQASEMIQALSSDPMFANAMGHSKATIRREDKDGRDCTVSFAGPAALLTFYMSNEEKVSMRVHPAMTVITALDCGLTYGIDPHKATALNSPGF